jgi:hypothetical protein
MAVRKFAVRTLVEAEDDPKAAGDPPSLDPVGRTLAASFQRPIAGPDEEWTAAEAGLGEAADIDVPALGMPTVAGAGGDGWAAPASSASDPAPRPSAGAGRWQTAAWPASSPSTRSWRAAWTRPSAAPANWSTHPGPARWVGYGRGRGHVPVALGLKVAAAMSRRGIGHPRLVHPAACGRIRGKETYAAHVREVLLGRE